MKRTAFAPRKKPMARGSWSRKSSPLPEGGIKTSMRRTAMKSRIKKPTVAEGSKYLEACRGERCYLQIPGVCRLRDTDETCVPAHRNEGKGMGLKVDNRLTCPACYWCHTEYDQGKLFAREYRREIWNNAYAEWAPIRARKMGIQTEELEVA